MINRECLDWDLWSWVLHLSFDPILVMYALRFLAKKAQFLLDENLFFFFLEIDSHRNSPGSDEKKILSSLTSFLKNITGSVFHSSFLIMQEMSSYGCVYSVGALGSINNPHAMLAWTYSQKSWVTGSEKQLSYDQSQPRIQMKPLRQKY